MRTFIIFSLICAISLVTGEECACKSDFSEVSSCLRNETQTAVKDFLQDLEENRDGMETKVNDCFRTHCGVVVDFNADPFEGSDIFKAVRDEFLSIDMEKIKCLAKHMIGKAKAKFEQCVSNYDNSIDVGCLPDQTAMSDKVEAVITRIGQMSNEKRRSVMNRRLNAIVALDRDCQSTDRKAEVVQCIKRELGLPFGGPNNAKFCAATNKCRQSASDECQRVASKVKSTLCYCAKDVKSQIRDEMQAKMKEGLDVMCEGDDPLQMVRFMQQRKQEMQDRNGDEDPFKKCNTNDIREKMMEKVKGEMTRKCNEQRPSLEPVQGPAAFFRSIFGSRRNAQPVQSEMNPAEMIQCFMFNHGAMCDEMIRCFKKNRDALCVEMKKYLPKMQAFIEAHTNRMGDKTPLVCQYCQQ